MESCIFCEGGTVCTSSLTRHKSVILRPLIKICCLTKSSDVLGYHYSIGKPIHSQEFLLAFICHYFKLPLIIQSALMEKTYNLMLIWSAGNGCQGTYEPLISKLCLNHWHIGFPWLLTECSVKLFPSKISNQEAESLLKHISWKQPLGLTLSHLLLYQTLKCFTLQTQNKGHAQQIMTGSYSSFTRGSLIAWT